MRILIIGFLVFCSWTALSTYLYVCKIKGLCGESKIVPTELVKPEDVVTTDTLTKPSEPEALIIPENLIIYFAYNKADFKPDEALVRFFDESKTFLDQNPQAKVSITGHTDAKGTDQYNQDLGLRRAQSVQHYFISKGIPAGKVVIDSKGEKEPVDDNNTDAGRAKNRRTVLTIKN
jgi:outer membrane protein OmpA-like peptidoglycan-associated protein